MSMRFERVSVAAIFVLALLGVVSVAMAGNKPVPLINQPLVPDAVAPGGPAFILTVNGTGFVNKSVVEWNSGKRTTTVISHSQLTATISARDIATAGTASVTVVNPAPTGGTSNVAFFSITGSTSSVGFRLGSSPVAGAQAQAIAVGDFNGDGILDLAVTNVQSNTVSILLGDGTGNFTLASSPATGTSPLSVAVGDFDGDGRLDLAVGNWYSNTLSILLGDGTGNFTLASSPATGSGPRSVAVGDFNGDGKADLVVANYYSNTVSILLGDGTGNFTLASSPATGNEPSSVVVGDFNGDGKLDLAVTNLCGNNPPNCGGNTPGTLSILLGDGTGNFTLASSPATGNNPTSVAVGNFNGDGNLDLAVANPGSSTLSVLLGDGTGNFTLASSPATGTNSQSVAVGDFNADGKLDLAAIGNYTVATLLGDGTGNFTLASSNPTLATSSLAVGDFNGDGKQDLAVTPGYDPSPIFILLQAPAVTLSPSSLTFGNQTVGTTSAPQAATLTNVGYASINISGITIGGSDSGDFSQTNTCPTILSVGQSCAITVTFTPVTGGTRTATVSVSDTGGNNPQTISLTGTGLGVKLSKKNLNFGNVMVGKISQPQIVVLTNIGSTTLTITSIKTTGADPGDFSVSNTCNGKVRSGETCNIVVRFIPTQTGLRTAAVSITDDGGGSPQKIKLSGTGT